MSEHKHDPRRLSPAHRRTPRGGALALAIERSDWERASLLLLLALARVARVARSAPPGTIDDLLALLSHTEEAGNAEVRS